MHHGTVSAADSADSAHPSPTHVIIVYMRVEICEDMWTFYHMFHIFTYYIFCSTQTLLHTYNHHNHHHHHGSHIHLHIESPPTWQFKNTQPFDNSGAEQRQGCSVHVSTYCTRVCIVFGPHWRPPIFRFHPHYWTNDQIVKVDGPDAVILVGSIGIYSTRYTASVWASHI
jgi:hypothetical protein